MNELLSYQPLPETKKWSEKQMLKAEKEVLGLYVSSHPLKRYKEAIEQYSDASIGDLPEKPEDAEVLICGIIDSINRTTTKKGKPIAYFTIEDLEGIAKCVIFERKLKSLDNLLHPDEVVFIKGKVGFWDSEPSIRVTEIITPEDMGKIVENKSPRNAMVNLKYSQINDKTLCFLRGILSANKGLSPVFIKFEIPGEKSVTINTSGVFSVSLNKRVLNAVNGLIGEGSLEASVKSERRTNETGH